MLSRLLNGKLGEEGTRLWLCTCVLVLSVPGGQGSEEGALSAWRKGPLFLPCTKVPCGLAGALSQSSSSNMKLTVLGSRVSDSIIS